MSDEPTIVMLSENESRLYNSVLDLAACVVSLQNAVLVLSDSLPKNALTSSYFESMHKLSTHISTMVEGVRAVRNLK